MYSCGDDAILVPYRGKRALMEITVSLEGLVPSDPLVSLERLVLLELRVTPASPEDLESLDTQDSLDLLYVGVAHS